jgi:hypothetical protein
LIRNSCIAGSVRVAAAYTGYRCPCWGNLQGPIFQ